MEDTGEQKIIDEVLKGITDWQDDMSPFFAMWNEWANSYRMIHEKKERRPDGVSNNMSGETTRAVNAIASCMTKMQTDADPYFELRSNQATEDDLFALQKKYEKQLTNLEFKRNLFKGNRGLALFGTQVWEEPYMTFPRGFDNPWYEGTGFYPLSLLQCAFRSGVYDINWSDFFSTINYFGSGYLRFLSNTGAWDKATIETSIKEKEQGKDSGDQKNRIESRRSSAGYTDQRNEQHELILWHGRLNEALETPLFQGMWEKNARMDDPKYCDITIGILNRKHIVRFHPTPYGTWHHMYKVGHYIEFELEPIAYGIGALGGQLQKDMNRILRRTNDAGLFALYNMHFLGNGASMDNGKLNVFPWAFHRVKGDVNQIKDIKPQENSVPYGLKLMEYTREEFRGVTHATSTLQAVTTGATATEASLAQSEALRAVSLMADINSDVIRKHLETMHKNEIDQNPFDSIYVPNVEFVVKTVTDKDFRPERSKKLLEFLQMATSIRATMPLDFNPMPIIKELARSSGIDPRQLKEPRPQIDRMLDAMQRINGNTELKQQLAGEVAGMANPGGGISQPQGDIPTSPVQAVA